MGALTSAIGSLPFGRVAEGLTGGMLKGQQAAINLKQQQDLMNYRKQSLQAMSDYRAALAAAKAQEGSALAEKVIRQGLGQYAQTLFKSLVGPNGEDNRAGLAAQDINPDDIAAEANRAMAASVGPSPGSFVPRFGSAFSKSSIGAPAGITDLHPDVGTAPAISAPPAGESNVGGRPVGSGVSMLSPDVFKDAGMSSGPTFPSATPPGYSALGRGATLIEPNLPPSIAPRLDRIAALTNTAKEIYGPTQAPTPSMDQLIGNIPNLSITPPSTQTVGAGAEVGAGAPPAPSSPPSRFGLSKKTLAGIAAKESQVTTNTARQRLMEAQTGNIQFNQDLAITKLEEIEREDDRRQKRWAGDHDLAVKTQKDTAAYQRRMAAVQEGELAVRKALEPSEANKNTADAALANAQVAKAIIALSDTDQAILKGVGGIYKEVKGIGGVTLGWVYDPVAGNIYSKMFGLNLKDMPAIKAGVLTLPNGNQTIQPGTAPAVPNVLPPGYKPGIPPVQKTPPSKAGTPTKAGKAAARSTPTPQYTYSAVEKRTLGSYDNAPDAAWQGYLSTLAAKERPKAVTFHNRKR